MIRKPTKIDLRQEDDYYEYEEYKKKQSSELANRAGFSFTQKSSLDRNSLVDSSFKVDSFKGFSSPGISSPQEMMSNNRAQGIETEFQEVQREGAQPSQFNQIFSMLLNSTMGNNPGSPI